MKTIQITIRRPTLDLGGSMASEIRLPISLISSTQPQGKGEEIQRYVEEETLKAIPVVQDRELMRFRLNPESDKVRSFRPYFIDGDGDLVSSYSAAGFSDLQIRTMSQGISRSIYIFELFDTLDPDIQRLLSQNFAKASDSSTFSAVTSTTTGGVTNNLPLLEFANASAITSAFSFVGLPMYHITQFPTGSVYMKISFFNAATGKRVYFRQRDNSLSLVDKRFIEIKYTTADRSYRLPVGSTIELEEVPPIQTQADAEQARQKRLNTLDASFTLGKFEPLGAKTIIINSGGLGDTVVNGTSGTTTTTTGTTSTGVRNIIIPNIKTTATGYSTPEAAASAPQNSVTTSVYNQYGILSIGVRTFLTTDGSRTLADNYYGYIEDQRGPVRVLRVRDGFVTELNIETTAQDNSIRQVGNTTVSLNPWFTLEEACQATFTGDIQNVYTQTGLLSLGVVVYTAIDSTTSLSDGFYVYRTGTTQQVLAIFQGRLLEPNMTCPVNPNTPILQS